MSVSDYSIILGRDWQALIGGYYSMDGSHIIIPKGPKNIIIYREEIFVPYIEILPQSTVNYVETDLGVYSIFDENDMDDYERKPIVQPNNDMWYMHFDGTSSKDGSRADISLYNSFGKTHSFSLLYIKFFLYK